MKKLSSNLESLFGWIPLKKLNFSVTPPPAEAEVIVISDDESEIPFPKFRSPVRIVTHPYR